MGSRNSARRNTHKLLKPHLPADSPFRSEVDPYDAPLGCIGSEDKVEQHEMRGRVEGVGDDQVAACGRESGFTCFCG